MSNCTGFACRDCKRLIVTGSLKVAIYWDETALRPSLHQFLLEHLGHALMFVDADNFDEQFEPGWSEIEWRPESE
jgi:hypothetical protein